MRNTGPYLLILQSASVLGLRISKLTEIGPVVEVPGVGTVQGKFESIFDVTVESFLGIRYAQAPIGSNRFLRPQPAAFLGNVTATEFGSRCPQPLLLRLGLSHAKMEEDCLNLNIYRKRGTAPTSALPVIVIIHGGGFSIGSSGDVPYNGGPLAGFGDVVTVTLNYRLGILGFADMGRLLPGNVGLFDQRLALQWIQNHIAAFGGNPQKVTLLGVSAGAMSISAHIVSPLNKDANLFQNVIVDAGDLVPNLYPTSSETYERLKTLGRRAGCNLQDESLVTCLQMVDYKTLIKLSVDIENYSPILTYHPTLDGEFIPEWMSQPLPLHAKDFVHVRMMTGYATNEGSLFCFYYLDPQIPHEILDTEQKLLVYLKKISRAYKYELDLNNSTMKKTVMNTYDLKPSSTPKVYGNIARFMTDGSFACPMNAYINAYAAFNNRIYVYHNSRILNGVYLAVNPKLFGAYHLSTFFGLTGSLLADKGTKVDPADQKLFLDGIAMTAGFAKGDGAPSYRGIAFPNFAAGEGLLRFTNKDRPMIVKQLPFQESCRAVFDYYNRVNRLWKMML
ncbi:liver carboxylesterase 1-like [Tropilaelaps mercedesae]|uniref:Carboxylic ester hydrolase n=1 Tax=Tropilaelaps mercedesae TaxID=418985 RepID=A0A1V9X4W7_9ACAR|nr:liver carboxylesterase 1-like [Tropilaelaps mercedesae]